MGKITKRDVKPAKNRGAFFWKLIGISILPLVTFFVLRDRT